MYDNKTLGELRKNINFLADKFGDETPTGRIWFDDADNKFKLHDNIIIKEINIDENGVVNEYGAPNAINIY